MKNICIYCCLLSALGFVEMSPSLIVSGHVGTNVSIICSNWNVWGNIKKKVKYLCRDPCKNDEDIIVKAESGKTAVYNRVHLNNTGEQLIVTFTQVQKTDSGVHICGLEKTGFDSYMKWILNVTEAATTPDHMSTTSGDLATSTDAESSSQQEQPSGFSFHTNMISAVCASMGGLLLLTGLTMLVYKKWNRCSEICRKDRETKMNAQTTIVYENVKMDGIYLTLTATTMDHENIYSTITMPPSNENRNLHHLGAERF